MDKMQLTHSFKQKARSLGFSFVGFARSEELTEEGRRLEAWLHKGYQGKMQYLENHFEKRINPSLLVEGTKSVITLLYNYYNPTLQTDPEAPKISMYAYGADYHDVIRKKLNELLEFLRQEVGQIQGRGFVDSAPIMEREWAKRSGLGWIGKHTLLINKQKGSYFFLSELLVDIDFVYDSPIKDYCGTCTRCIDACPTQAIHPQGFTIDASLCISYFTIEYKEELPVEMREQFDNWMFGCDICQRVCPWNRFAEAHQEPEFLPSPALLGMNTKDWQALSEETFQVLFKRSPVKRTKYAGLTRNIKFLGKMP